jgi:hypothetical protein
MGDFRLFEETGATLRLDDELISVVSRRSAAGSEQERKVCPDLAGGGNAAHWRKESVVVLKLRSVPLLLSVIALLFGMVVLLSVKAFALSNQRPVFSAVPAVTSAKFAIPRNNHASWTLKLWSHGRLIGSTTGTAGILSVSLPAMAGCGYQADIQRMGRNGNTVYFSGNRVRSACCPPTAG